MIAQWTFPRPRYTGLALYGSCYQQCVINLLEWQGLPDAEAKVGLSWGYSWPAASADPALEGSGRWLATVGAVFGVELSDRRFDSVDEAIEYERALLAEGCPVASTVDAYLLPSPFQGVRHITHCVLPVAMAAAWVSIVDPMNNPEPTSYPLTDWRAMRAADCAQDARVFAVRSAPTRPDGEKLLHALAEEFAGTIEQDEAVLDGYLTAWDTGLLTGIPDVSGVAAERRYLAKTLTALAQRWPALESTARAADGLEARWYLAHTLAVEAQQATAGPDDQAVSERHVRLIRDLGRRDLDQRQAAAAVLSELAATAGEAS